MMAGTAIILLYIWTSILVLLVMGTVSWADVRGILMPLATLIVGWLIPSPVTIKVSGENEAVGG